MLYFHHHIFRPLVKTTVRKWSRRCLSPFPLAEELSCAVSQLVLHVPVTALDRSSGSQHPANWWTVCDCVGVCVCMCACCPQSTLLILLCSVSDTLSGFGGSPLVSLVLCLLHLFTPQKHSQIYYPSLSLSPSIFHSLYISLLFTPDFSWLVVSNQ